MSVSDSDEKKVEVGNSSTHSDAQTQEKVRQIFQDALAEGMKFLQSPGFESSDLSLKDLCDESELIQAKTKTLQFLSAIVNSKIARDIFSSENALKSYKEASKVQSDLITQAVAHSLLRVNKYIHDDFSSSTDTWKQSKLIKNLNDYAPEDVSASKLGHTVRIFAEVLGEKTIKQLLTEKAPLLLGQIEKLSPEDQKILFEMQGRLDLFTRDSPANLERNIVGFIEVIAQLNSIKDEEMRRVIKQWIFTNNSAWQTLVIPPIIEFANVYDLESIKPILEASSFQDSYFNKIAKKWFFGLLTEMQNYSKEEFLRNVLQDFIRLKSYLKLKQMIPEPIHNELYQLQLELLFNDNNTFEGIRNASRSLCGNLLHLAGRDPQFLSSYLKSINKLDFMSKLYLELFLEKQPLKTIQALKPVFEKIGTSPSPSVAANLTRRLFEKFPQSFHQSLPELILRGLPDKKDFIENLTNNFPANPDDIKLFFVKQGEQVLYESLFEVPDQFWNDFHEFIASTPYSDGFFQWMSQQLLMKPSELKQLTPEKWIELSKSFSKDFVDLIRELISVSRQFPDLKENLWKLFQHDPTKETMGIIFNQLQNRYSGYDLLIPFLLEHSELIPDLPIHFKEYKFVPILLKTPLPIVKFIFRRSETKDQFEDMLRVLAKNSAKLAKIVEIETMFSQPLIWTNERKHHSAIYTLIKDEDLDAILKDSKLQEYLKEGNLLQWENIPKGIYSVAPDLPLKLTKLFKEYKLLGKFTLDDKDLFEALLKDVVHHPGRTHLAQKLVDFADQCIKDDTKVRQVLPKSTFESLLKLCKEGNETVALELFKLMYPGKDEKLDFPYLDHPKCKAYLSPLIEAIAKKYKTLESLPTVQEKLQNLPIEWKQVLIEFIQARMDSRSLEDEAFEKVLKNPTIYAVARLANRQIPESKTRRLQKSFYTTMSNQNHIDRVNKSLSRRFYNDFYYKIDPDLYVDWFEKFPFHTGLNSLFDSVNKPLQALLKSLDYSRLEQTNFRESVLTLAQLHEWELLKKIVIYLKDSQDETLTLGLLDMAKAGYIPEAMEILSLKEKKQITPLEQKLLNCANSPSGEWIQRIMALRLAGKLNPEIEEILARDLQKLQFSPLQKSLLILLQEDQATQAQRLIALMKKKTDELTEQDKKALHCYSTQSFELAELYSLLPSKNWKGLSTLPIDSRLVIPLAHLLKDCEAAGKEIAWEALIPLITSDAPIDIVLEKIGMLQYLLVHKPDQISTDFKQWDVDPLEPVRWALERLNTHKIENASDKSRALETELAFHLAKMLTTASGQINTGLIPLLIKNIGKNLVFTQDSDAGIYLRTTLQNFLKEPLASDLLSKVAPASNRTSPSTLIIKKMFGFSESESLTPWHAQVAALSALLFRTRQGNIGSCYATSFAIIIQSDTQNLLQSLRDYREMIMTNGLRKSSRIGIGNYTYPMKASQKGLNEPYPFDNLLVREREILISRMSGVTTAGGILNNSLVFFETNEFYDKTIKEINSQYFGRNVPIQPQSITDLLRKKFLEKTKGVMEYDEPDPVTGKLGHWSLERREGNKRIVSMEDYLSLHIEIINEALSELISQSPELEEYYLRMRQPLIQRTLRTLPSIVNTTYWSKGPEGGYSLELRSTYHQLSDKNWPTIELPGEDVRALLDALFKYVQTFPLKTKERIENEPELLLDLLIPSHSIGLMPYQVLDKIKNGITSEKMIEQLSKPSSIMMGQIPDKDRENLVQNLCNVLPAALAEPFRMEIANLDIKSFSLDEFGHSVLKTVEEINGGPITPKVLRKLHRAFYTSLPNSIKEQMPHLIFADLDWNNLEEHHNNVYLAIACSPLTGQLDYFFTNRRGVITGLASWNVAQGWTILQPLSRVEDGRLTYKKLT